MKKKRIIIASILGATALIAGASAVTIITSSVVKSKEVESIKLEDSTLAEDELFGGELPSLIATKKVQKAQAPSAELVSPVIGRQYAYDEVNGTVSIRFFAAITSLDVDAVWTRALYNADGSVNTALAAGTKKSTVAYETLKYKEGGVSKQLNATDVEAEDGTKPFKYFVLYTLKNVKVSTYGECTIDAYVEISNDAEAVVSKTGSVTTSSAADMSSYTLDLDMDNTYQGSNTSAGNGQYINGKVKTIYTMSDTAIDTTNLEATLYKNGVEQPKTAKTTTLSFKGDTANEASNYLVYADQAISSNPGLTLGMFTILDNGQGAVADNGDWLKFNAGGKVKFTLNSSAKLSISFYQDNNNVKVYVGDTEVAANSDGSYSLSAGNITIEAVSSGYLGKIIVEEKELVTASGFNAGVAGMQTITAKYKNASATYNVYVVDTAAYQDANNNYVVTVDKSYTGEIGEISGTNGNMFTTISQALEFLQNSSIVPASANKILNIGAGYYYEKLEITTPNLTINGSGTIAKGTYASDVNYDADDFLGATVIEFDTLYGVTDTNGFVHTTDSTQTVAIRETATNCKINGVTISNKWNCKAYFDAKGVSSEHRALALLVQADQFVMNNSSLLGYQDTLELFTGRQYFSSCYISGATDYIFGTNNTTLFNGCEIHSIYTGNGGFINAFKGCNRGDADYVDYGAIYYKCDFTADSGVTNTSIARPWGSYSNVAVIECTLDGHISKEGYASGATASKRYVEMNYKPTDSNVKFVEYNNIGTGAITEAVSGMSYLNSTTAANYYDFSVIYGKTNGAVSYDKAWNPVSGVVQNSGVDYYFDATEDSSATSHLWRETSSGAVDTTFEGLTIKVNKCKYNSDQNGYTELQAGTISFEVAANSLVTVKTGFGSGTAYSISGSVATTSIYPSATGTVSYFFEEAQTVTMTITGKVYLLKLSIEPNSSKPTISCSSLSVTGNPQNELELNAELDLSGLQVKSINSNGTYNYLSSDEYEVDTTEVNPQVAGTYAVTITLKSDSSKTTSFDVTYVATVSDTFETNTTIDFTTADGVNAALNNQKITWQDSDKVRDNTGSLQLGNNTIMSFKVKAGATVTVTSHSTSYGYLLINGVSNNSAVTTVVNATSDMTITIGYDSNHPSNCYIKKVDITYPAVIQNDLTISFATGGNGYGQIDGVTNTCYVGDHNDGSAQIKNGTITLSLKAAATVTIEGNWGIEFTIAGIIVDNQGEDKTQTSATYVYEATSAGDLSIVIGNTGSNYFKSIKIEY